MTVMINDFTATSLGTYEWLLIQFFHELIACKLYHYVVNTMKDLKSCV